MKSFFGLKKKAFGPKKNLKSVQYSKSAKMVNWLFLPFWNFSYPAQMSIFPKMPSFFSPKERLHENFVQNLYLLMSSPKYVCILVQIGDFLKKPTQWSQSFFFFSFKAKLTTCFALLFMIALMSEGF